MNESNEQTFNSTSESPDDSSPAWTELRYTDRRVAGVLVEKAKTTPANYPLTLNSIQVACNQKNNRFPQLQLTVDQVYESVERLKQTGAIAELEGDSRSPKYRHLLYQWLDVDKIEIAVMGELLLRGAQTLGELRGRAARMEPISGLAELRPIVDRLYAKNLIVYLTPPGRGCIVTHNLYDAQELEQLKKEHGNLDFEVPIAQTDSSPAPVAEQPDGSDDIQALKIEIQSLRDEVAELREQVQNLNDAINN